MILGDLQSVFQLGLAVYLVSDWFKLTHLKRVRANIERGLESEFRTRGCTVSNILQFQRLDEHDEHRLLFEELFDLEAKFDDGEEMLDWGIHSLGAELEVSFHDLHRVGQVSSFILLLASCCFAANEIWLILGFALVAITLAPWCLINLGVYCRYRLLRDMIYHEIDQTLQCYEQAVVQTENGGLLLNQGIGRTDEETRRKILRLAKQNLGYGHSGVELDSLSFPQIIYGSVGILIRIPTALMDRFR